MVVEANDSESWLPVRRTRALKSCKVRGSINIGQAGINANPAVEIYVERRTPNRCARDIFVCPWVTSSTHHLSHRLTGKKFGLLELDMPGRRDRLIFH